MMRRDFQDLCAFRANVGSVIGVSDWFEVSQDEVDAFARVTKDEQWIHVDRERAASGPFGGTIAHGFFTLSLIPAMAMQIFSIGGLAATLNYGLERVRFPSPALVGVRLRGTATLAEVVSVKAGTRCQVSYVIDVEGGDRPCCVADVLFVAVPASAA